MLNWVLVGAACRGQRLPGLAQVAAVLRSRQVSQPLISKNILLLGLAAVPASNKSVRPWSLVESKCPAAAKSDTLAPQALLVPTSQQYKVPDCVKYNWLVLPRPGSWITP